ncbi:ArsR family transcriptional regulator [Streptomyces sp. SW4]|nr:ArsR family transcriptional regulator [Streptomyces sp. SW4]
MVSGQAEGVRGHTSLELGPLDELRLSVAGHQGATVLSLLADAFGGRPHGVPPQWRRLVTGAAPPQTPSVLRPLFAPDYSVIPDCITPTATMPGGDVALQCEQLGDLSTDVLLGELEAEFREVPPQWRGVVDRPRQWLEAYRKVIQAVWQSFQPVWDAARPFVAREAERIGSAVVRDCTDAVLRDINSRFRLTGSRLLLPDPQTDTYRLDGRRLVLVPIVSGPGTSMFALDRPDLVWIGYPCRAWGGCGTPPAPPAAPLGRRRPLSLVTGAARARILRAAATPRTMGELATATGCSPANLTHHCRRLEQCGLIVRVREGQYVRLHRTERGDRLVDLLSS